MDVFDLYAKISLDSNEYENKLGEASKKTSSFASKLGNGLKTAAKIGGAAIAATATAFTALGKTAISAYGDYEQLTGGVETLFKNSSDTVMQYAENAYKTAGLSANEYMSTVTSFSASLLQSLDQDTEAAAQKADMAITDMSDNANKMGTDISMIQNAYQGFAKQNFTMLDNLKLGYGGTKEEMERLLEEAEKISGFEYDISSYADIVDAIHIVQNEIGITGTTAAEASSTIQGSISSMKSAWENFLAGMADPNQDFDALLGNLMDSILTVGENIIPRIQMLLPRLVEGVSQLAQGILPYIPDTMNTLLPVLIEAGITLIITLATTLIEHIHEIIPQIIIGIVNGLKNGLPKIADMGKNIVRGLWEGIQNMASWIKEKVSNFFGGIVDGAKKLLGIHSPSTVFAEMGKNMALGLGEGWDNSFGRIQKDINNSMEFETKSVDVKSSAVGRSNAPIILSIDGHELARFLAPAMSTQLAF